MKRFVKAIVLLIANSMVSLSYGENCNTWKDKAESMARALNGDGNYSQKLQWEQQKNYYWSTYDRCQKQTGANQGIETAHGGQRTPGPLINYPLSGNPDNARANESLVRSEVDDAQLQKLIETCNYWIAEYNSHANRDNQTFKETACRAAQGRLDELKHPHAANHTVKMQHSAKDCMKPNNVFDKDVKDCMQGLIEKTW